MSGKKKTARVMEHDSGRVRTTPAAITRSASEQRDELGCVSALRDVVRYVEKCDTIQASHYDKYQKRPVCSGFRSTTSVCSLDWDRINRDVAVV